MKSILLFILGIACISGLNCCKRDYLNYEELESKYQIGNIYKYDDIAADFDSTWIKDEFIMKPDTLLYEIENLLYRHEDEMPFGVLSMYLETGPYNKCYWFKVLDDSTLKLIEELTWHDGIEF